MVSRKSATLCFIDFVLILLFLSLVAVVLVLVLSTAHQDKAPVKYTANRYPELDWWKKYAVYQIYPRSFQDTDGNGIGDLSGITRRLSYLEQLGIRAVRLNPIYKSPMKDLGYDVSDYRSIDPIFGTMADFKRLLAEIHKRKMYLIMDFVPNHSSNEHEWFRKSELKMSPFSDYYVWQNGTQNETSGSLEPPNNWISRFEGSAWNYSTARQQFYLHEYLAEQPDLNYRSANLRREMEGILKFWLELGVDGFRIDVISMLVENGSFPDEPRDWKHPDAEPGEYHYLRHIYTKNQPETFDVVANWTQLLRNIGKLLGKHIFTVGEVDGATPIEVNQNYWKAGIDYPFNFALMGISNETSTSVIKAKIQEYMDKIPAGMLPNWAVGNHDNHRIATRMGGRQYTDIVHMLLLLLPGLPSCYYGDEIGMDDVFVPFNESQDPHGIQWGPEKYQIYSRDPERTPMQWTNESEAGFTTANHSWLPVAEDYTTVNVRAELAQTRSHLNLFKQLLRLRVQPTFLASGHNLRLHSNLGIPHDLLVFSRYSESEPTYLVVLKFGTTKPTCKFTLSSIFADARRADVVLTTQTLLRPPVGSTIAKSDEIVLAEAEGVVLKLVKS